MISRYVINFNGYVSTDASIVATLKQMKKNTRNIKYINMFTCKLDVLRNGKFSFSPLLGIVVTSRQMLQYSLP